MAFKHKLLMQNNLYEGNTDKTCDTIREICGLLLPKKKKKSSTPT